MLENKMKKNNYFQKLPHKKLFAFTLAEILLVFAFIGIIATTYTINSRAKVETTQKKLLLYNLFKTLNLASTELARTNIDNSNTVPDNGTTFCQELAELFNTVGDINCSSSLASFGTDFSTPNFVTSNGMSFYNVSAAPIADISDASKLVSTSELQTIHERATNQANAEISSVMTAIGADAETKARSRLPERSYIVNANFTKIESGTPSIVENPNGSYEIHSYNYNIELEHNGTVIPIQEKVYKNNATCYEIIKALNGSFDQEIEGSTSCSNTKTTYTEKINIGSNSKYSAAKAIIDRNYEQQERNSIQLAVSEATSDGRKLEEKDKLYQKYYNQYFQEKYQAKAASLPTVHNIYVDINGKRGNSKLNEDVFLFLVRKDGKTVPAKNSDLANTMNIISAKYYARNNTALSDNLPFRAAACSTASFEEKDYLPNGYCEGYAVNTASCPRANACYYKINQPKSMWSLF